MIEPQDVHQPIDHAQALEIARKTAAELPGHHDFVIMEKQTVERPFGWVFFYAPRQYVLTGNRDYLVPGARASRRPPRGRVDGASCHFDSPGSGD